MEQNPGKIKVKVADVTPFLTMIGGAIIGIFAWRRGKKAGHKEGFKIGEATGYTEGYLEGTSDTLKATKKSEEK